MFIQNSMSIMPTDCYSLIKSSLIKSDVYIHFCLDGDWFIPLVSLVHNFGYFHFRQVLLSFGCLFYGLFTFDEYDPRFGVDEVEDCR